MQKIESFRIDHTKLLPGLYVSRRDKKLLTTVTTFDLRFTSPNREPVMDMPAIHTLEHLGATFLRNSAKREDTLGQWGAARVFISYCSEGLKAWIFTNSCVLCVSLLCIMRERSRGQRQSSAVTFRNKIFLWRSIMPRTISMN